jgi:TonB family protein
LTYALGRESWTANTNRRGLFFVGLTVLRCCLVLDSVSAVQAQPGDQAPRQIVKSERPSYPLILKSKGIGGVVRLDALVLANGKVAHVEILGGNPILVTSAVNAVLKWKYAPALSASEEIVTLEFNPH